MPVVASFDGVNRKIYLAQGVTEYHPVDDIYKEYRDVRRLDENLRKYFPLIRAEGNVPKGGGKATPRYLVLLDGTKVVPYNELGTITQTGDMITNDPDNDPEVYDLSGITQALKILIAPSEAEIIYVNGGSSVPEEISYNGGVYIDVSGVTTGTAYPKGTEYTPVNNLNDARLISVNYGFKTIYFKGSITLAHAYTGWNFVGMGSRLTDIVNIGGQDVTGTSFSNCTLTGNSIGQNCTYAECIMDNLYGASGIGFECVVKNTLRIGTSIFSCMNMTPELGCIVDINGTSKQFQATVLGGSFSIINAGSGSVCQIGLNNMSELTLNSTDLSGSVFTVTGFGKVINNSMAGTLVNKTTRPMTFKQFLGFK